MKFYVVYTTFDRVREASDTLYRCVVEASTREQASRWALAQLPRLLDVLLETAEDSDLPMVEDIEVSARPVDEWLHHLEHQAARLEQPAEEDIE